MGLRKISSNALGRLAYRLSGAGLVVWYNLIAQEIFSADDYGLFFILTSVALVVQGIVDFYNPKYLVFLFSSNRSLLESVFLVKLAQFALAPLVLAFFTLFYGVDPVLGVTLSLFVFISCLSSTLSTYYFCEPLESHYLLKAICLSFLLSHSFFAFAYYFDGLGVIAGVLSLLVFKLVEFLYLFAVTARKQLSVGGASLRRVVGFVKLNHRTIFYVQWVASLLSSRMAAFILPVYLGYDDISFYGKAAIVFSIYYFWLTFSALSFYRDITKLGFSRSYMCLLSKQILISYVVFAFGAVLIVNFYFEVLLSYLHYILFIGLLISFTAYQGYILLYYRLDRYLRNMSIFTLVVALIAYFTFVSERGLKGAFEAAIFVEIASIVLFLMAFKADSRVKTDD